MPPLTPGTPVDRFDGAGIYVAPFPASYSDGWAPYWLTTDTTPLVLPPSNVAQLAAQPMTFQGDADILIVDMVCSVSFDGAPSLGFRAYPTWGARGWSICNNNSGLLGENIFGTSQLPYRLDRPWWIKANLTAASYINWAFTNTQTATNTIEIVLKGWRRTSGNG
jgi:hypothetical protein